MNKITKTIKIERNAIGRFNYISPTFDKLDISECELMILLGGILGVNITNQKKNKCSWQIDITKIYNEE